jgi:hypothetical protein
MITGVPGNSSDERENRNPSDPAARNDHPSPPCGRPGDYQCRQITGRLIVSGHDAKPRQEITEYRLNCGNSHLSSVKR